MGHETCRYLAFLDGEEQSPVQAGVLNVNVVLEAFGNAKTVYNNNSSRFVGPHCPHDHVRFLLRC